MPPERAPARKLRPDAIKYLLEKHGIKHTRSSLDTMRCRGGGPKFYKAGPAILYGTDHLDAYATERLGEAVSSHRSFGRGARPQSPSLPNKKPALTGAGLL